jgi:hypothetical protein
MFDEGTSNIQKLAMLSSDRNTSVIPPSVVSLLTVGDILAVW